MKKITYLTPCLILIALLLLPASIKADTVAITGGTLTYSRVGPSAFSLTGQGLVLNGQTSPLNPLVSLFSNGNISPGQTGSTGGSVDSQDSELQLANPVTVGSVPYSPGASLLVLSFSSSSYTAPLGNFSGFIVVTPFALTAGIVEGYLDVVGVGEPIFSSFLTGQGTTTLLFLALPTGQYRLESQSFAFGQTVPGVTVTTIPEPVSMLLLGTGLMGLLGARKKMVKRQIE
ncbi:MAG: PEP-CTERM sorting domain-containing protein [Pyrinomonadaceae bacterium]|jgi:hypothetical protein|nr:PEP-CTERM sorting domain-containing protein [Pyrinomonadaceae bacterium]